VSHSSESYTHRIPTASQSLTVLDYCLHQGSENVVIYFRDNAYVIKTLKEFQYIDEDGKDQGANVRQKAKDISNLLVDESRLREERNARAKMRDRMMRGAAAGEEEDSRSRRRDDTPPNGQLAGKRPNRDEEELRKAIEESKRSLAADRVAAEERDLQQAIKLSEEEEAKRKNAVEDSNASALFDDQNQLCVIRPLNTDAIVDFFFTDLRQTLCLSIQRIQLGSNLNSPKFNLSSLRSNLSSPRSTRINNRHKRLPR